MPGGVAMRRVIAVLVRETGPVATLPDVRRWLRFADPDRAIGCDVGIQQDFARWLPSRRAEAAACAQAVAQHLADAFAAAHRRRMQSEAEALQRWLRARADDLCGVAEPCVPDLFGAAPAGPAWRTSLPPLERLAGFAHDANNPAERRREANSVVVLFRARDADGAERAALSSRGPAPAGIAAAGAGVGMAATRSSRRRFDDSRSLRGPDPQRQNEFSLHLPDCSFAGPALPEPFVRFELAHLLARLHVVDSNRLPAALGHHSPASRDDRRIRRDHCAYTIS